MTVTTSTNKVQAFGTGVTTSFPYAFRIYSAADLVVTRTVIATGVDTVLTLNTDYTVTGAGSYNGGNVVCTSAPADGTRITIRRVLTVTQGTDLRNQGGYFAETHEDVFDRHTMIDQQQQEQLDRSLTLPASSSGVSTELPNAVGAQVIGWNEDGTALRNYAPVDNTLLAVQLAASGGASLVGFTKPDGTTSTLGELPASTGATLVGSDDGASGALWTTVAGFISRILSSAGASVVGFIQSGTGAVARTVQDKLRDIVSRSDYDTDANFNTAKTGKPNIDGSGNFDAPVTPDGEATQIQLAAAVHTVAAGPRDAVMYYNANGVRVYRDFATMGGFRFRGHYTKGRAPTFPMPASNIASLSTGLGAGMTAATFENWYAVFACANDGDATAVLKIMPFLRLGDTSGATIPFIKAGEGIHTTIAQSYAWGATDNLAGTDCLVITETIDSRANAFSGRVTTITGNSTSVIALTDKGALNTFDFILPAPPGYDNYVYLGSFYFDTAEVRNIADTGTTVKAKMVNSADPNFAASGSIASPVAIRMGGYISPLATACIVKEGTTLSTTSTGDYASYFAIDDGGHTVQSTYYTKLGASNETVINDGIVVPFSFYQSLYFSNGGSLVSSRAGGTLEITGWIEP